MKMRAVFLPGNDALVSVLPLSSGIDIGGQIGRCPRAQSEFVQVGLRAVWLELKWKFRGVLLVGFREMDAQGQGKLGGVQERLPGFALFADGPEESRA